MVSTEKDGSVKAKIRRERDRQTEGADVWATGRSEVEGLLS